MIEIDAPVYRGIEDFTFFIPTAELREKSPQLFSRLGPGQQVDETVCLKPQNQNACVVGRLNASSCFGGQFLSCSFRATGPVPENTPEYHIHYDVEASRYNLVAPSPKAPEAAQQLRNKSYLSSIDGLCELIFRRIFPILSGTHGLIIVAGATATGKSQIARGLIYKYIKTLVPQKDTASRRPHLVTFEDPIDKLWADDPDRAKGTGIDYTPRELNKDVASLEEGMNASLRQTPKIFFVGETRNPEDWKLLLRFASTGHLAVTTSHAGSLTEAMGQLLRAAQATNPAQRSEVSNRVVALVHLRSSKISEQAGGKEVNVTIPAVWVRSPVSMKTLMADGLTALLPYRDLSRWDEAPGTGGELGCLGRSWFAAQLLNLATPMIEANFGGQIRRLALTWDLEGI